jgi:hypothetical protein
LYRIAIKHNPYDFPIDIDKFKNFNNFIDIKSEIELANKEVLLKDPDRQQEKAVDIALIRPLQADQEEAKATGQDFETRSIPGTRYSNLPAAIPRNLISKITNGYRCCYILSNMDKQYFTQLANSGCVEGDRNELLTQIKSNKNFCRGQLAIRYDYFVETLENGTIIYIQNESDNKILGVCSIMLGTFIYIDSICVPDDGIKGIGTLLLNKVKYIGELINAYSITLSATETVYEFYIKNGFTVDNTDDDINYDMIYKFKQQSARTAKGGTRKATLQKNKSRHKKGKITKKSKKRNNKFSKRSKN